MNKPKTINAIFILGFLRIAIIVAVVVTYILIWDVEGNPFLEGVRDGIKNSFGLDGVDVATEAGMMSGVLMFPFALTILLLVFVGTRRFWGCIVVIALDILVSMASGLPIFPAIMLGLVLSKSTKQYLKRVSDEPVETDVLDQWQAKP